MIKLSNKQILLLCETGSYLVPIARAIAILNVAMPDSTDDELLELSIGQRNAYLLKIREENFGAQIPCVIDCKYCQESLEFQLNIHDLNIPGKNNELVTMKPVTIEKLKVIFRPINCADLARIRRNTCAESACNELIKRCLLAIKDSQGQTVEISTLSETFIEQLAEHMQEADPQAEIILGMKCACCHETLLAPLDVLHSLWSEIVARAKQLFNDVHCLALSYGWSEELVLSMSDARRQVYIQQVT